MTDSLRDQLLGLGFKPAARPERPERPERPARREGHAGKPADPPRGRGQDAGRPGRGDNAPGGRRPDARAEATTVAAPGRRQRGKRPGGGRSQEDIDLAKAYAIRAQREKQERIDAERLKQEEARLRREAKARFAEFVKDKALNVPEADIARHFDYGGKIKRVYVTAAQLQALNAGELGVAQLDGRYLLLAADVLAEAEAIFAPAIALKVDPAAPAAEDPYADPRFQVPDDLVW